MMLQTEVVVFDLETTGFSTITDAIVEIGALKIIGDKITDMKYETLVHPTDANGRTISIPRRAQAVHNISDDMVKDAPTIDEVLPAFLEFVGGAKVVAHNLSFDTRFMLAVTKRFGLSWQPRDECCTLHLSRCAFPRERTHNLGALAERLGLTFAAGGRHRSFGDVEVTAQAYLRLSAMLDGAVTEV